VGRTDFNKLGWLVILSQIPASRNGAVQILERIKEFFQESSSSTFAVSYDLLGLLLGGHPAQ
jgi:hypothetical protein